MLKKELTEQTSDAQMLSRAGLKTPVLASAHVQKSTGILAATPAAAFADVSSDVLLHGQEPGCPGLSAPLSKQACR